METHRFHYKSTSNVTIFDIFAPYNIKVYYEKASFYLNRIFSQPR